MASDTISSESIRDWFAGQALAGMVSQVNADPSARAEAAFTCWDFAEAMMAERHRRYGKQVEPEAEVEGAAF